VEPRISLITLGVTDIARARGFYEKLGFKASSASEGNVAFYDAGGVVLALWERRALADDAGLPDEESGFRATAIAHNVRAEDEVARVLAEAEAAGAAIVRPVQRAPWGGTTGYFSDPDGHLWEVAHNPFFPLDDAGAVTLPYETP
jgi:catechol 2,3-dioxygenase-like lactoylglutathione lyase family enzyme